MREIKANEIRAICSKEGCPRTRIIDREPYDPPMAVIIKLECPWHESGESEVPRYFTNDGKEIYEVGDNEYEIYENPELLEESTP